MALIPVERQTPLEHMDARAVLRARLPPEPAAPVTSGEVSKRIGFLASGASLPLASVVASSPDDLVLVQAVAQLSSASPCRVYYEVQWTKGAAEGPSFRFYQADPFTLPASRLSIAAFNPSGVDATGVIHASLAVVKVHRPARPLWSDFANMKTIAFGATDTFQLGPFTRRIRVGRQNPATPFTVTDVIGGSVQVIAANGEFGWREAVGPFITVTNNAAAAQDVFTLFEELGL